MISSATSGGQVINYSQRFTINGMTGTWQQQSFEDGYTAAKGSTSSVPPTQDQTTGNQNNPGAAGAGGPEYSVPYQMQTTGLTKYAPMQQHPPTAITKQDAAALFPTSLFILAETALPTATQLTTLTASRTYSYSTSVNSVSHSHTLNKYRALTDAWQATPASPPNDMQKFLARWKD